MSMENVKCNNCQGKNIVKWGKKQYKRGLLQVWKCKDCGHKFQTTVEGAENNNLSLSNKSAWDMKTPDKQYNHMDLDILIQALKGGDRASRRKAAKALGKIGDEKVIEPLIQAMRDEDWGVRKIVVEVLSKIRDSRAIVPLL